jgi:hypothetical protein
MDTLERSGERRVMTPSQVIGVDPGTEARLQAIRAAGMDREAARSAGYRVLARAVTTK